MTDQIATSPPDEPERIPTPKEQAEYDRARRLHATTDARVWAHEFDQLFRNRLDGIDESLMLTWFANAIMVGHDEGARRAHEAMVDAEQFKADYLQACRTIAEMHAAATGRTGAGPIRGVVEDVADLRSVYLLAEQRIAELERLGQAMAGRCEVGDPAADAFDTFMRESSLQGRAVPVLEATDG